MRRITSILIVLSSIAFSACKTLSLAGEQVQTTKHESDVIECKMLGEVIAKPPFIGPDDPKNALRNKTAKLGGDVVLLTDMMFGSVKGIAYDCNGMYSNENN